jgi:tetratricopeptide (TPR) repeat protein
MENWTAEKMEHYLDGDLPDGERQALEADLGRNPELRQTLERHYLAREAIERMMREKMADIYGSLQRKPSWLHRQGQALAEDWSTLTGWIRHGFRFPVTGRSRPVWVLQRVALAAGALLVLGFALDRYADRNYSDAALVAETYRPEPAILLMGDNDAVLRDGFNAYQRGDFPAAIRLLRDVPATDPMYLTASFYLGHSYLNTGEYPAAMIAFERVAKEPASPFARNADWNRVLAMLGRGMADSPVFQAELDRIADDPGHNYAGEARALRAKLRNPVRKVFL